MDISTRAKEKLLEFLILKWNPKEADYFENSPIHRQLNQYTQEMFNGNNQSRKAHDKLMRTLTEDEKVARVEYLIKKLEKTGLEFMVDYGNNSVLMNEFTARQVLGLNCARNHDSMNLPTQSQNQYLN